MIALRAIAPLHHPLNRYAVTGGALRRVLVDFSHFVSIARRAGGKLFPLLQKLVIFARGFQCAIIRISEIEGIQWVTRLALTMVDKPRSG